MDNKRKSTQAPLDLLLISGSHFWPRAETAPARRDRGLLSGTQGRTLASGCLDFPGSKRRDVRSNAGADVTAWALGEEGFYGVFTFLLNQALCLAKPQHVFLEGPPTPMIGM